MIIPAGFAQVTFVFEGATLTNGAACVVGVDNGTDKSAVTVASEVGTAFEATILTQMENAIALSLVRAKKGPNTTGASAEVTVGSVGGLDQTPLVVNTALLITKNTNLGGREGRGRMYIPGLAEEDVGGSGTVAAARVNAFQDEADDFMAALDALDLPMVVLHNSATTPTAVVNLQVQSIAATQRRRLRP